MNYSNYLSDDGLIIFLFHGVIERHFSEIRNYKRKHLQKDYFEKIINNLKKNGNSLSMDEVIDCYVNNINFKKKSFAITFDDGYENNFSIAAPILIKYRVPTTFYITTDFVDKNHMSWIDRIEYCIENTPEGELLFPWNNQIYHFKTKKEKIDILENIRNNAKKISSIDFDQLVKDICSQCNQLEIEHSNDSLNLKMNWDQVKELNDNDFFIIGGHSHTHKILSFLNHESLENEIKKSIDLLKNKADLRTDHYSYPEGLEHCYSDGVIKMLKKYKIKCCPTAEEGINNRQEDLFHLKRIMVT